MSVSIKYFITAKIFELIGFILFCFAFLTYSNVAMMLLCSSIGTPIAIDFFTHDFFFFGIVGLPILILMGVGQVIEYLALSSIFKWIVIALGSFLAAAAIIVFSSALVFRWVEWNKKYLK